MFVDRFFLTDLERTVCIALRPDRSNAFDFPLYRGKDGIIERRIVIVKLGILEYYQDDYE